MRAKPAMVTLPAGTFQMGATSDDKFADACELPRRTISIPHPFAVGVYPVTQDDWKLFDKTAPPGRLPVVGISWHSAVEYARWLGCRLLTEAEWEYACRAETETVFNTGDSIEPDQANFLYLEHGEKIGPGKLLPVGSFPPNRFGLFDMHGNVCEWVADAWNGDPAVRVVRGGGWDHMPRLLRSARRDWLSARIRMDNVGFRLAADV